MATKNSSRWSTISMHPLTGLLDVRSRPADLPPGAFRYKQNCEVTSDAQFMRRGGFVKAFTDILYDPYGQPITEGHTSGQVYYHNHDHHCQNAAAREPITFLWESTASDGTRRLFDGTASKVSVLDVSTGFWTDLKTGVGGYGKYWQAAELQDYVVLTNDQDTVLSHKLGTTTVAEEIPELKMGLKVERAKVVVEFCGFILIMNVFMDGETKNTRILWSDLNKPLSWLPGNPDTLAGMQDLPYGDEILNAKPMLGSLYIYTRRSIWKMTVGGVATFDFTRVYNEPKNQRGCLVFPRTLVSTGSEHWYMSREGIYKYNPYIPAPERDDWMHRASGIIYTKIDTKMYNVDCNTPCAEFVPNKNELWFSWGSQSRTINNYSLVAQLDQKTADVVDHGFTAFVNFRRTPTVLWCNEQQMFLGASGSDYAIKDIGTGFYRELLDVTPATVTADQPSTAPPAGYVSLGYNSIARGMLPLGYTDRDKIMRNVLVDIDATDELEPCVIQLRIGNSYKLVDPNDEDDVCQVQWRDLGTRELSCPDAKTISQMTALNQRPDAITEWTCFEQGRFLYFELEVKNADGGLAVGGDCAFQRIDVDVMALVKG